MVHFHSAVPKISTFPIKKHKIFSLYMLKAVCVGACVHVLINFFNFLLNCNLFNVLIDDKIKVINDSLFGID